MNLNLKQDLFSSEGRINRTTYWIYSGLYFVFFMIVGIIAVIVAHSAGSADETSASLFPSSLALPAVIVISILGVLACYTGIVLGIKRYHDRGKSGWWILIGFIPYIGALWMLIECGFLPGDEGSNQYGDPQE